jgi:hypothetical protein
MDLFKYTRFEHEESLLLRGEVRIGTLFDFRRTELHGEQIGDVREGQVNLAGEFENVTHELTSNHPVLSTLIKQAPGAKIGSFKIDNLTFSCKNLYVFSASKDFSEQALKRWYDDPNARYDSCYVIHSARLFFRAISRAMKGEADFVGLSMVTYYDDQEPIDLKSPLSHLHPASLKPGIAYEHQIEYRAFWQTRNKDEISPVTNEVPDLHKYVSHKARLTHVGN